MPEPLLCVRDAERAAAGTLPRDVMDFVAGGSEAELTLAANRAALDAVFLTPRVLAGITACEPGTMLWGLANGGARGAAAVFSLLADELAETMTLAGCPDVGSARMLCTTALTADLATAGEGSHAT
jgi:isopentenyl diphosphate isomerase/L-lactate dehydrogenase-like FMN-dependent dehydrogenase